MKEPIRKALALVQQFGLDTALVRFSKIGLVNRCALVMCWDKRNYESFFEQYEQWSALLKEANINVVGKSILEIGSGGLVGMGYFFLLDGAARWVSSDPYQDPMINEHVRKTEELIAKEVTKRFPHLQDVPQAEFQHFDAADLQKDFVGAFDIIMSSAVMEHVPRASLQTIFDNLKAYLKPDGVMLHEIDLRDHINVSNPHHFLKYSATDWEKLVGNSIFYTNRLRSSDFKKEFTRKDLHVLFLKEEKTPLPKGLKIADDFSTYTPNELETTVLTVILQKNV